MHVEWDKAARILNFAKSVSTALDLRDHIEDLGVVEEGGGGGQSLRLHVAFTTRTRWRTFKEVMLLRKLGSTE